MYEKLEEKKVVCFNYITLKLAGEKKIVFVSFVFYRKKLAFSFVSVLLKSALVWKVFVWRI